MSNSVPNSSLYPIEVWEKQYWSCLSLYRDAPVKPSVSYYGFKSRLMRFYRLHRYVNADAVRQCLFDPPHAFDGGGVIYEIVQESTGRRYIGITDDPAARWKQHKLAASRAHAVPRGPSNAYRHPAGADKAARS